MKILLLISCIFLSFACGADEKKITPMPDLSKAKSFSLEKSNLNIDQINNTKFVIDSKSRELLQSSLRKNDRVVITNPEAHKWTFEERAQTAMKAAVEIQNQIGLDAVIVELRSPLPPPALAKSEGVAVAEYAPDGKGFSGSASRTWDVLASKYQATDEEMQLASYWQEHRAQFDKQNMVDEKALKQFIIKKYSLKKSVDDKFLPAFTFDNYKVQ